MRHAQSSFTLFSLPRADKGFAGEPGVEGRLVRLLVGVLTGESLSLLILFAGAIFFDRMPAVARELELQQYGKTDHVVKDGAEHGTY